MRKKKKNGWQAVVTILLVCASILYIAYQAYRSVYAGVETELAVIHSTYESIETEGRLTMGGTTGFCTAGCTATAGAGVRIGVGVGIEGELSRIISI